MGGVLLESTHNFETKAGGGGGGGRRRWREVYSKKAMSEVDAGRDRATPAARHCQRGRDPLGLLTCGGVKIPRRDRWSVGNSTVQRCRADEEEEKGAFLFLFTFSVPVGV